MHIWPITSAAGVPSLTQALSCGARPSKFLRWRSGFSTHLRWNKNKFLSMKPNLNHLQQLLFHTILPPHDQYNLFWSYKKRVPKPLLGHQNWVTSTCGRHNSARVNHGMPGTGVIGHKRKEGVLATFLMI